MIQFCGRGALLVPKHEHTLSEVRSRLADVANAPPRERAGMTTLGNRPATALLVIDVQNAAVDGSYQRDAVSAEALCAAFPKPDRKRSLCRR